MIHHLTGALFVLLGEFASGRDPVPEQSGEQTTAELLQDLDQGASAELLWALFERNEQAPEVIEALSRRLHETDDVEARRAIDTLLNHWQVPHEAISRELYLTQQGKLVPPDELLPWKVAPLTGEQEQLVQILETGNAELRLRAALALMLQGEHQVDALRAVLPSFFEHDWIQGLAGAALGEAIGAELGVAVTDADRLYLLRVLEKTYNSNREGALDAAMELVLRSDPVGEAARRVVLGTYEIDRYWTRKDSLLHSYMNREELTDPTAQGRLLKVARWLLEDQLEDLPEVHDPESLELVMACGLRSEVVREAVIPRLVEILRKSNSPHTLRILCHLGAEDEYVRERYLATMHAWKNVLSEGLERVPCWKHHDEETLAAFDRVFTLAEGKLDLVDRLVFAGLVDSSEHDITRRFFEYLEEEAWGGGWAWLRKEGFRHVAIPSADEPRILQVNKLGLTIATLMERGEDYSECASSLARIMQSGYDEDGAGGYSDYYEWGFFHALALDLRGPEFVEAALLILEDDEWVFWNHQDYARALLVNARPSAQQARRIDALPSLPGGPQEWYSLSLLSPDQQDGDPSLSNLREVPRFRQELYRGKTEWLENLCATTPLIPRDEEYLLALLSRGSLGARQRALEMIRDFQLDSPAIRAGVAGRDRDCDHRIRELAADIALERGW